jgi:hypothetical protein
MHIEVSDKQESTVAMIASAEQLKFEVDTTYAIEMARGKLSFCMRRD